MRHSLSGKKLGRTASHRKAMYANMATSILEKERITTTIQKAKAVRSLVERLITYGKKGGLHSIRIAGRYIKDKTVLKKLFDELGPRYKEREGGYTRIVKLGNRDGDNAEMSIMELVGREGDVQRTRKKKKPAAARISKRTEGKSTIKSETMVEASADVVNSEPVQNDQKKEV
jgi:large subunit ribosomal protein L17